MKQVSTLKYLTAACLGASLLAPSAYALDKNFKLNGFMRVGTIQTNAESDLADFNSEGGKNYPNVDSLTTVGLQATYNMSPKDDFIVQVVGRGLERFDTELEWAYVTHKITNKWTASAGRMRTPFFMLSESQEVGFSYPTVYLPNEMYRLFATTANGVRTSYKFTIGDWLSDIRAGLFELDNKKGQYGSTLGFNVYNGRSLSLTLSKDDWTFYLSTTGGRINVDVQNTMNTTSCITLDGLAQLDCIFEHNGAYSSSFGHDTRTSYNDLGITWDPGNWYLLGEVGQLNFGGGFLDDKVSGYLLLGYHVGKWLPYAIFSKGYTQSEGDQRRHDALLALGTFAKGLGAGPLLTNDPPVCPATTSATSGVGTLDVAISRVCNYQQEQTTYGVGVRYDINPRLAAKAEISYATDLNGTYGTFYYPLNRDNATIVALSLDGVF